MRITKLFLPVFICNFLCAHAQDPIQAYNLSNMNVQGTARSMGFGNALGSIGGDFSSLSVNPAGIGIYRNSELTLTASGTFNATTGEYLGNTSSDYYAHNNISSFGMVFTNAPHGRHYDRRKWKTFSFALGMNRVADFNQNYTYQGVNTSSSESLAFESDANKNPGNATTLNNSLASMGYQSYLLNRNASGQYFTIIPFTGGISQQMINQSNGGINEFTLSFGGNYKEKLMLGVTFGMPVVNYQNSYSYSESLAPDNNAPNPYNFSSYVYSQTNNVSGAGINTKIGAIYKVNDIFRVGLALHTPTFYSLTDRFTPFISTTHNDTTDVLNVYNALSENIFHYNLVTPFKGVLSGTVMLNKFGFITADYELVDYSTMRYYYQGGYDYTNNEPFQQEQNAINEAIKQTYKPASNFRIGAEGRFGKCFMARAGFGYYGDPYTAYGKATTPVYYTTERIDLSCGVGFHFKHFYTDLGYVHSMLQGFEQPYSIDYTGVISGVPTTVPTAKIDYSLNNLAWTVGVKF